MREYARKKIVCASNLLYAQKDVQFLKDNHPNKEQKENKNGRTIILNENTKKRSVSLILTVSLIPNQHANQPQSAALFLLCFTVATFHFSPPLSSRYLCLSVICSDQLSAVCYYLPFIVLFCSLTLFSDSNLIPKVLSLSLFSSLFSCVFRYLHLSTSRTFTGRR